MEEAMVLREFLQGCSPKASSGTMDRQWTKRIVQDCPEDFKEIKRSRRTSISDFCSMCSIESMLQARDDLLGKVVEADTGLLSDRKKYAHICDPLWRQVVTTLSSFDYKSNPEDWAGQLDSGKLSNHLFVKESVSKGIANLVSFLFHHGRRNAAQKKATTTVARLLLCVIQETKMPPPMATRLMEASTEFLDYEKMYIKWFILCNSPKLPRYEVTQIFGREYLQMMLPLVKAQMLVEFRNLEQSIPEEEREIVYGCYSEIEKYLDRAVEDPSDAIWIQSAQHVAPIRSGANQSKYQLEHRLPNRRFSNFWKLLSTKPLQKPNFSAWGRPAENQEHGALQQAGTNLFSNDGEYHRNADYLEETILNMACVFISKNKPAQVDSSNDRAIFSGTTFFEHEYLELCRDVDWHWFTNDEENTESDLEWL